MDLGCSLKPSMSWSPSSPRLGAMSWLELVLCQGAASPLDASRGGTVPLSQLRAPTNRHNPEPLSVSPDYWTPPTALVWRGHSPQQNRPRPRARTRSRGVRSRRNVISWLEADWAGDWERERGWECAYLLSFKITSHIAPTAASTAAPSATPPRTPVQSVSAHLHQ